VHLDADGAKYYASLLVQALDTPSPTTTSTTSPPRHPRATISR
jgi:hypothetical protein